MPEQVEDLNTESIARLHVVNMIRDRLHTEEITEELKDLGIKSIVFYGSAMEGIAKETSDIDLYAIHEGRKNYGNTFDRESDLVQERMRDEYEQKVANLIKVPGQEVSIEGPQHYALLSARGENLKGIVHILIMGRDDSPQIYDKRRDRPAVLKGEFDGIELWRDDTPSKPSDLLSRLFGLK